MNYYEEFGIPRDASAAKIRQAYKTLARVLHPDAHRDEALKGMAERQMTRLNAMLEASGLSRVEFCRKQELSLATLARYRKTHQGGRNAWLEGNADESR